MGNPALRLPSLLLSALRVYGVQFAGDGPPVANAATRTQVDAIRGDEAHTGSEGVAPYAWLPREEDMPDDEDSAWWKAYGERGR